MDKQDLPLTPHAWLWQEIAHRFGVEAALALYDDYIAASRRYMRVRRGSTIPRDAPAKKPGRHRVAIERDEDE